MENIEVKTQIRTFTIYLLIGLLIGNSVNMGFNLVANDRLTGEGFQPILFTIMRGVILYAIVGAFVGLALRRDIENFQENEMFILAVGWGIGGAIEFGLGSFAIQMLIESRNFTLNSYILLSFLVTLILATICGLSIAFVLQRSLEHIKRKQMLQITGKWLMGWAIGAIIFALFNYGVVRYVQDLTQNPTIYNVVTALVMILAYGLSGGSIGGRAIYLQIHQIDMLSDPDETKGLERRHTISAVAIGAVTAMIGGTLKYILIMNGVIDFFGIPLPFFFCLLTPAIGGLLAWAGVALTKQIKETWRRILICGLAGGIITTLVFFPIPYMAQ